jgi:hypothetical protein
MYSEVNILGVYVAPFVVMMIVAWGAMLPVLMLSNRYSLPRLVWHRGLFNLCIYLIILSIIVVLSGAKT